MEAPLLYQAIESVRMGFYDDARRSLLQFVRQDPNNALAWLWLAQALDDPKRQLDCLRQVLRIDPDNQDAVAGMEALRAGRPLPEPGGGVVVAPEEEPEPELFTPEQAFGWGALFDEAPAIRTPVTTPPSTIVPPPVEEIAPALFFPGEQTPHIVEKPHSAESPPVAEPPSAVEPAAAPESFLQRARRMRAQGFAAPAPPETSPVVMQQPAHVPPFIESVAEVAVEAPASALTPTPSPARKFRLFDRRVFFSILGLIELPILMMLGWLLLRGRPVSLPGISLPGMPVAAPQPVRPASKLCRDLDLGGFTLVESLGGVLAADTIFTGTQVLITDTLVVPGEYRLLIYPGATLVFSSGTTIEVYGVVYACGNEDAPVTFTAWDETPGGWAGIRLYNPNATSVFHHARIDYAGERALYLLNSVPDLLDVTIANSALFPISFDGVTPPNLAQTVHIADNPVNGVEVRSGTLTASSVVWPNTGFAYVVTGPLWVEDETTLDIQTGVIVKFWRMPEGKLPGIWVRGLLKATGVQFTSLYDSRPEVGGVTYREALDPHPGDWGSLSFYESSQKSYLRNVSIRYGGYGTAAVFMQASSPELRQVTIADSAGYPLGADLNAFPVLDALTFTDNRSGNAMEIYGGGTIGGEEERVWGKLGGETPIARIIHDTITVGSAARLTIQPGVVLKFTETGKLVVRGALSAAGGSNPEEKIIFTSLHDDEYGGDSDGVTTPQDSRAWGGIRLERVDATTDIQNVIVRYAPVVLVDAAPKLSNLQLFATSGAGLQLTPGSSPTLRGIQFAGNGIKGIAVLTGTIETDQTWGLFGGVADQVVRVLEGEVIVKPNAVLKIDPGVVIKAGAAGKLTVLGHLTALGRSNQEVVFTSLHDERLGDTNNRMLNPGANDWLGIDLGPDANVHLAYIGIYYAQVGLTVRGKQLPIIDEGRVHIAHGRQPLACTARLQISPAFLFEDNEVGVTRCPSP
ncbi:MAG TPA: hypothetical protein PKZ84_16085 [Anaerolineae bacterium]|nr:hypothetical protein [Anaerolineae bacterium]HQI86117.1 hypothetical protein [Anaerolineae bacterium]